MIEFLRIGRQTPRNSCAERLLGDMSSPGASGSRTSAPPSDHSEHSGDEHDDDEIASNAESEGSASDGENDTEEDQPEHGIEPLSAEALAKFEAAQARTGIVYISRIPPAMRPSKVRHLMSGFGTIGRVYLQQEGE